MINEEIATSLDGGISAVERKLIVIRYRSSSERSS